MQRYAPGLRGKDSEVLWVVVAHQRIADSIWLAGGKLELQIGWMLERL